MHGAGLTAFSMTWLVTPGVAQLGLDVSVLTNRSLRFLAYCSWEGRYLFWGEVKNLSLVVGDVVDRRENWVVGDDQWNVCVCVFGFLRHLVLCCMDTVCICCVHVFYEVAMSKVLC